MNALAPAVPAEPVASGALTCIDRVLLVEDSAGDARLVREMFNEQCAEGSQLTHVTRIGDGERHLAAHAVDIIVLDLSLPDVNGLGALRRAHAAAPGIPVVVLTGRNDEAIATQALQQGAQDYLLKGQIDARGFFRSLRYAVERKHMEEAMFEAKERAEVTLNSIADAVTCTDRSGQITFLNAAAERITGWSRQESEGRPFDEVVRIVEASTRAPLATPMEIVVGRYRTAHVRSNCLLLARDGRETPIEESVAPIRDRQGQVAGAVLVCRDVSMARETAVRMVHSAQHDFLTGLPNRMLLNDRLSQAIALARRHKKKVALLFLDLDGFKRINDSLGHQAGDNLLRSVAKRLVESVRRSDTVSRQGGDEFVVLLAEVAHLEDAAIMARKMLQAVAAVHAIDHHAVQVTTSIGVSVYPDDGEDGDALIRNADTAMYQAKQHGRQSYQFFTPAMNIRAVQRQFVEENLRVALERRELALHYQPKIDLRTGRVSGAEALLRWTHPDRGLIAPADLISVAQDCGLMPPIGQWVLSQACRQARAWIEADMPLRAIAVNISAMELRHEHFLTGVFAILEETGLDPRVLQLELAEGVLMNHAGTAESILKALKLAGVQLTVDDFATGYSSLNDLGRFPIDTLKVDQSFVRRITETPEKANLVTAVMNIGRSLGLRVVAEGVETQGELAFLHARGCDEVQGYYFCRPVPADEFASFVKSFTGQPH